MTTTRYLWAGVIVAQVLLSASAQETHDDSVVEGVRVRPVPAVPKTAPTKPESAGRRLNWWNRLFRPERWKDERPDPTLRDLPNKVPPIPKKAAPAGTSRNDVPSDAMLVSRCRAMLSADTELSRSRILVEADEGVLLLSGAVHSSTLRERAEQIAQRTSGARSVSNKITLTTPVRTPEQGAAISLGLPVAITGSPADPSEVKPAAANLQSDPVPSERPQVVLAREGRPKVISYTVTRSVPINEGTEEFSTQNVAKQSATPAESIPLIERAGSDGRVRFVIPAPTQNAITNSRELSQGPIPVPSLEPANNQALYPSTLEPLPKANAIFQEPSDRKSNAFSTPVSRPLTSPQASFAPSLRQTLERAEPTLKHVWRGQQLELEGPAKSTDRLLDLLDRANDSAEVNAIDFSRVTLEP